MIIMRVASLAKIIRKHRNHKIDVIWPEKKIVIAVSHCRLVIYQAEDIHLFLNEQFNFWLNLYMLVATCRLLLTSAISLDAGLGF